MAPAKFDVIVCGSLHLDIVVHGSALPKLDETAVGQSWDQVCGGKGGNQAVQAARLGARTAMIGRVGSDDFGTRLLAHLDTAGIDRSMTGCDGHRGSGMSVAIVDANGDYGAVIVSGANLAISPESLAGSWTTLGGARVLILQNEVPDAVNISAAIAARQAGAKVIYNAAPARKRVGQLLDFVDVLVVNRVEAGMMAAREVTSRTDAMAALPALGADRRTIIITLGGDGLVVSQPGHAPLEIAALPVRVVSTHGAGDCFVGALATRLAAGEDLIAAAQFANQAAGAFVSAPARMQAGH